MVVMVELMLSFYRNVLFEKTLEDLQTENDRIAEKIQEGFSKFGFVPQIDLERLVVEIVDDDDDGDLDDPDRDLIDDVDDADEAAAGTAAVDTCSC